MTAAAKCLQIFYLAAFAILLGAYSASANSWNLEQTTLSPAEGKAFDVVLSTGIENVDIAELEKLGTYRITTTSPWESGKQTFEGPLLADVVAYLGLDPSKGILLRSLDGYTATVPPEDWQNGPVILATRQDGKSLTRRMKGPTRIVYPELDHPAFKESTYKPRWIWLMTTIEQTE